MISELMRVAESAGLAGYESRRQRPIHWFVDLDADGRIDARDLAAFNEYWLERTDCNQASITLISEPEL